MIQLSLDFLERQIARFAPVRQARPTRSDHEVPWKNGLTVHVMFRARARRYLLNLRDDGSARLVIPRRGTKAEGLRFLERSEPWLLKRLAKWRSRCETQLPWQDGTRFLFRGDEVELRVERAERGVRLDFVEQVLVVPLVQADYREAVLRHLRRIAERELPLRTRELAVQQGIDIGRVSVRAQKSRWGSCSARGTISLNWRLIQAPPSVVDYLIIHELMHRRQMNHSKQFWKIVAQACPEYQQAEAWLKAGRIDLRS